MKKFIYLLPLLACILIAGCEGPEGPAGPQGQQGPKGEQGPAGDDGSANVQSFEGSWDTADISWDMSGQGEVDFNVDQITSDIADNGVVLAYYGESGTWVAIPLTLSRDYNGDGTMDTMEFTYGYQEGTFACIFFYDGGDVPQDYYPTGTVKVVIIPPSQVASKLNGQESIPYSDIKSLLD